MSRRWPVVRFASREAADSVDTGRLSMHGPPGVTMMLAMQPAANDTLPQAREQQRQHQGSGVTEDQQGTELCMFAVCRWWLWRSAHPHAHLLSFGVPAAIAVPDFVQYGSSSGGCVRRLNTAMKTLELPEVFHAYYSPFLCTSDRQDNVERRFLSLFCTCVQSRWEFGVINPQRGCVNVQLTKKAVISNAR